MTSFAWQSFWRVAYDTRGTDRPTIVFVHGASSDRAVWQPVVNAISGRFQTIALDRLGYGESDAPDMPYRLATFAESVLAVLDQEDVRRAVLVGHSNGVAVARQVYREAPNRVSGLVFLDGELESGPSKAQCGWMRAQLDSPDYAERLERLVDAWPMSHWASDVADALRRMALAVPRHIMLGELDALEDETGWTLDPIDVPLLVIRAGSFRPAMKEPALVRKLCSTAEYEVWADVSHLLILEAPMRVAERLVRFVESTDFSE